MEKYYWYDGSNKPLIAYDGNRYHYYKDGKWLYDKQYHLDIYKMQTGRGSWWSLFSVTKEQAELYMKGLIDKPELN